MHGASTFAAKLPCPGRIFSSAGISVAQGLNDPAWDRHEAGNPRKLGPGHAGILPGQTTSHQSQPYYAPGICSCQVDQSTPGSAPPLRLPHHPCRVRKRGCQKLLPWGARLNKPQSTLTICLNDGWEFSARTGRNRIVIGKCTAVSGMSGQARSAHLGLYIANQGPVAEFYRTVVGAWQTSDRRARPIPVG